MTLSSKPCTPPASPTAPPPETYIGGPPAARFYRPRSEFIVRTPIGNILETREDSR